jgi:hypothetical protein
MCFSYLALFPEIHILDFIESGAQMMRAAIHVDSNSVLPYCKYISDRQNSPNAKKE